MSKATSAESASAPTDEQPANTEPSVETHGTARALSVSDTGNTDPLYGTDRATARTIVSQATDHTYTEIRDVNLSRYGHQLKVYINGTVTLSYNDVTRAINTNTYEVQNFLSHSSGSVTVTLKT